MVTAFGMVAMRLLGDAHTVGSGSNDAASQPSSRPVQGYLPECVRHSWRMSMPIPTRPKHESHSIGLILLDEMSYGRVLTNL